MCVCQQIKSCVHCLGPQITRANLSESCVHIVCESHFLLLRGWVVGLGERHSDVKKRQQALRDHFVRLTCCCRWAPQAVSQDPRGRLGSALARNLSPQEKRGRFFFWPYFKSFIRLFAVTNIML